MVTNVKSAWVDGDLYFYDKDGNEIFHIDGVNRRLVMHASASLVAPLEIDATDIAAGAVSLAKMADLAQDKILGRATASTGVPEAITCTAAGRALLDDANAAAQLVTLGLSATAAEINALAAAASGLGSSNSYAKTDAGVKTLVAAHATKDRGVLVVVRCNETLADGDGTKPTIKIGETDSDAKCIAANVITVASAGDRFVYGFSNTATKAILATLVAGTGTATGGFDVLVLALPNS